MSPATRTYGMRSGAGVSMIMKPARIQAGVQVTISIQRTARPTGDPLENAGTTETSTGLTLQMIANVIRRTPATANPTAVLSLQRILMLSGRACREHIPSRRDAQPAAGSGRREASVAVDAAPARRRGISRRAGSGVSGA